MESELDIASSLLAPPKKDLVSLAKAQLSFMNMFAIPLFQGVADVMPAMKYTVDELDRNKGLFEHRVQDEQAKEDPVRRRLLKDGTFSPRTMSFAVGPGAQESSTPQPGTPFAETTTPSTLTDRKKTDDQELPPAPPDPTNKAAHVPESSKAHKEVNGFVPTFETVADFAASDPFHSRKRTNSTQATQDARQRNSETTDGSTVGQCAGDGASQATSATTGKMPISPSTQGTSIVSRDSVERGVNAATILERKTSEPMSEAALQVHGSNCSGGGSLSKAEGAKVVKKKSSRFRMNNFPFFRRNRGTTPPVPSSDPDLPSR